MIEILIISIYRKIIYLKLPSYHPWSCDSATEAEPPGHLQPLGSHKPPEGTVRTYPGFMEPDKFFHEHQQPGRPVVFKGAAVKSAALEKWNDRYLT